MNSQRRWVDGVEGSGGYGASRVEDGVHSALLECSVGKDRGGGVGERSGGDKSIEFRIRK